MQLSFSGARTPVAAVLFGKDNGGVTGCNLAI